MEVCILVFNGGDSATNALKTATDAHADRNPWIFDIGTVARPLNGRVRVSAARPISQSDAFVEDSFVSVPEAWAYTGYFVSCLAGPLSSLFVTPDDGLDSASAEKEDLDLSELQRKLSRNSSALVLIASSETGDQFIRLFNFSDPKPTVIRHDFTDELRRRLEALDRTVAQEFVKAMTEGRHASPEPLDDISPAGSIGRLGGRPAPRGPRGTDRAGVEGAGVRTH